MTRIPLASGAYEAPSPGLPSRLCENAYVERSRTLPDGAVQVVTRPGTLALPDWVTQARGYGQADGFAGGKVLAVVGSDLMTWDPIALTVGQIPGSIAGTDRVRIRFTETECGVLGGGVFHISDGSTVAAVTDTSFADLLSDHGETGFTDLESLGQRFVLTYGSRFCYTEPLDGNDITALNYYTAEFSSDALVGVMRLARRLYFFGTRTIEPWEETGVSDDPFRVSLGQEIEVGCRARDTIRVLDGSLYWVDQNNQVRRTGNAVIPDIISGPDVSKAIYPWATGFLLAFAFQYEGHAFYGIRTPERCFLFDANYNEWCRWRSHEEDSWRYGFVVEAQGNLFVGDAAGLGFATMHADFKSDHMPDVDTMGDPITCYVSGYVLTDQRRRMAALRIEGTKGIGLATGQGSDPQIQMRRSLGGANIFSSWRSRSLGAQGKTATRVIFNQMGVIDAPGTAIELQWTDPVGVIITGMSEDG